jgi:hypothetical protein
MTSHEPANGTRVDAEEVKRLFFLLGEEMQQIPKSYREAVFKKLLARALAVRELEPNSIAPDALAAFMTGWLNYPGPKFTE